MNQICKKCTFIFLKLNFSFSLFFDWHSAKWQILNLTQFRILAALFLWDLGTYHSATTSEWGRVVSCPFSSVHAGICWNIYNILCAASVFGSSDCSFVFPPDCKSPLDILFPPTYMLFYLSCTAENQVRCLSLCFKSTLLSGMWKAFCLSPTTLKPRGCYEVASVPPAKAQVFLLGLCPHHSEVGEESGILKPPWVLSGDASQVSSTPGFLIPDGMNWGRTLKFFLGIRYFLNLLSFWFFSLHLPVQVNFI